MVYIWALGLLAAGQSSTMTGTYTGVARVLRKGVRLLTFAFILMLVWCAACCVGNAPNRRCAPDWNVFACLLLLLLLLPAGQFVMQGYLHMKVRRRLLGVAGWWCSCLCAPADSFCGSVAWSCSAFSNSAWVSQPTCCSYVLTAHMCSPLVLLRLPTGQPCPAHPDHALGGAGASTGCGHCHAQQR